MVILGEIFYEFFTSFKMALILRTWPEYKKDLKRAGTRWRLDKDSKSPFIYVRDKKTNTRISCKPLRTDNPIDISKVFDACILTEQKEWAGIITHNKETTKTILPSWLEIEKYCKDDWPLRMKEGSTVNLWSGLNDLKRNDIPRNFDDIQNWVTVKKLGSSACRNRLDAIKQIIKALKKADPKNQEPNWLTEKQYQDLRNLHNERINSQNKLTSGKKVEIRGIPTQKEAEKYLDDLWPKYKLEQWCLAMLMNYGLRNHELHWVSNITEENIEEGIQFGWVYVPGYWRTKSKYEHWVFPLYKSWIVRYGLKNRFEECQKQLHEIAKPRIVSQHDPSKDWDSKDPTDQGICMNNKKLGEFIGDRLRQVLPEWAASVPDARGQHQPEAIEKQIRCYDLRHTYAIILATSPRFKHVDISQAALAMGHDIETHKNHYLKWVSKEEYRKRVMSSIILPDD
jgi:hypothetical protein